MPLANEDPSIDDGYRFNIWSFILLHIILSLFMQFKIIILDVLLL